MRGSGDSYAYRVALSSTDTNGDYYVSGFTCFTSAPGLLNSLTKRDTAGHKDALSHNLNQTHGIYARGTITAVLWRRGAGARSRSHPPPRAAARLTWDLQR